MDLAVDLPLLTGRMRRGHRLMCPGYSSAFRKGPGFTQERQSTAAAER